jgi:hypothetical protein
MEASNNNKLEYRNTKTETNENYNNFNLNFLSEGIAGNPTIFLLYSVNNWSIDTGGENG